MMRWDDDCTFVTERLELFLDGELAGSENLRFLTHLKECDACAATWADDEALSEAIMVAVAPDVSAAPIPDEVLVHATQGPERTGWWRFAATALAASLVTGLLAVGLLDEKTDGPESPAALAAVAVLSADADVLIHRPGAARPVRLAEGEDLAGGARFTTARSARLVLGVEGDRASIVLAEGTEAQLAPAAENVGLMVERGRVSLDVDDVECHVTLLAMEVVARNATFDVWTSRDRSVAAPGLATLVVSRGTVRATTADTVRRVEAGETWYLMEGGELLSEDAILSGVFAMQDMRHVERLVRLLETERARRHELEGILATVRETEAPTADEAVSAYLALQRETGLLDRAERDAEMRRIMARLAELGSALPPVLERRLREASGEEGVFERRAIIRLGCGLGLDGCAALYDLATRDPSEKVRRTVIACLEMSAAPWVFERLSRIAATESDLELRLDAAEAMIRLGEEAGAERLTAEYAEATGVSVRLAVARRLARVEPSPIVRRFFLDRLEAWSRADGPRLLRLTVSWLLDKNVVGAVPAMRRLAAEVTSPELLLLVQEALAELERH